MQYDTYCEGDDVEGYGSVLGAHNPYVKSQGRLPRGRILNDHLELAR